MTEDLARQIVTLATKAGLQITCAESCTGGKIAAALTDIAGSSAIFERGFVTYSNLAKTEMLGVGTDILTAHGAVSEPVVQHMARGAQRAAQADIAVSVSGIAGPGGSDFKPEGRVCYGLATAQGVTSKTIDHGALGRAEVRDRASREALQMLLDAVKQGIS